MAFQRLLLFFLLLFFLVGCQSSPAAGVPTFTQAPEQPTSLSPTRLPVLKSAVPQSPPSPEIAGYAFPASIDPVQRYLFYLHGKIIEDQGLPAVSPDFGEYEVVAILQKFASHGFVVISEQRPKNADADKYARKVVEQISRLLDAGVPPEYITVVGASKGAYIAAAASDLLKNSQTKFVLLGACNPEMVQEWLQYHRHLVGKFLAIYDSVDEYAGSCEELFSASEGSGIARHEEIVLHVGTGHGILYKPLDEWILPTVDWAVQ